MTADLVLTTVDTDVAVVTLNDPDHRNALSYDLTTALADAVTAASTRADVSGIVIAAAPPVYSAGGSVDDLLEPKAPLEAMYAGFEAIAAATVPTVAAVGGPAVGAGVNVALACDVIVCSPSARFDPRWLDVGIHPGGGNLWSLRERIGRQATAALVLCGESVDGEEAARIGLAWRCVPDDGLVEAAIALARVAARRDRDLVARTKATLNASAAVTSHSDAVALELEPQRWSMGRPAFADQLDVIRRRLGR